VTAFDADELTYLRERPLGRLATVGRDGTPHVVPVGWNYSADLDTIAVDGRNVPETKRYGDVARAERAAIVVDDLASVGPWRPRVI
jgi:pyridoxamine 5'-phosphate oxidase family protein